MQFTTLRPAPAFHPASHVQDRQEQRAGSLTSLDVKGWNLYPDRGSQGRRFPGLVRRHDVLSLRLPGRKENPRARASAQLIWPETTLLYDLCLIFLFLPFRHMPGHGNAPSTYLMCRARKASFWRMWLIAHAGQTAIRPKYGACLAPGQVKSGPGGALQAYASCLLCVPTYLPT